MLGFTQRKKTKKPMAGTGIPPNNVTIKPYKRSATLRAASKKKRPKDKQTEKQKAKQSRELNDNKNITVETTFTLNPPKGSIGILRTTYDVKIEMKGHARVISQEKKTVEEKEPKGDLSTKYKYHINKLLLEHIELTKDGIDDTILGKKGKQIELLQKIKKATKPKIDDDIETWLKNLGVKVFFIKGTKTVGNNNPIVFQQGNTLTTKPRLQDELSAEQILGESLFLGLKF